jgi:hypothetical protein
MESSERFGMALVLVMVAAFLIGAAAMACFGFFAVRESGLAAVFYEDSSSLPPGRAELSDDERARLHFIRWLHQRTAQSRANTEPTEHARRI